MNDQRSDRSGQPATEAAFDRLSPQTAAMVALFSALPTKEQRAFLDRIAPAQPPTPIPAMTTPERWLAPAEASKLLDLCPRTLRRYHQMGLLPARKTHGRAVRYRLSDLERVFRPARSTAGDVS